MPRPQRIGHMSRAELGAVPVGAEARSAHPRGMALRKTLEMLKRGEEINDALYRFTTRECRAGPRPGRAPMPWDRHLRLTGQLTELLAGRRLNPDAG